MEIVNVCELNLFKNKNLSGGRDDNIENLPVVREFQFL